MSFSFLLGVLASCISAFVTVNRFGFALEGAWCAFDRIYYDTFNGQLKFNGTKWEEIESTKSTLNSILDFCNDIKENKIESNDTNLGKLNRAINILKESCKFEESYFLGNESFDSIKSQEIKKDIKFDKFHSWAATLKACLKILAMIYYCLLLIAVTAAGVAMMFYACLKRQGYLITFMHVLWNIIRFFLFSFFLYGTA